MTPSTRRQALFGLGLCVLLVGGCVSLEQAAPSVTPAMVGKGVDQATLEAGRRIMLTSCVKCHTLEPLEKYSRDEWLESLVDMSKRAKLSQEKSAQLQAYVLAARAARGLP